MNWLRKWLCKHECCKWTGPCTREYWGARVFAFQCRSCKRFWMELYVAAVVAVLLASPAFAGTRPMCSRPGDHCSSTTTSRCTTYTVNGVVKRVCW